jgi:hypothetical protein
MLAKHGVREEKTALRKAGALLTDGRNPMHMNKAVLLLALLLSGCTTTFTHTTQAPTEFDRELYACQREAAPIQDRARSSDMIERCMAIQGWRKNIYAWWVNRSAPVTAQSSVYTADLKTSVADNPASGKTGPANVSGTARSATGATKTYGGGMAGSLGMQPSEPASTGGATISGARSR